MLPVWGYMHGDGHIIGGCIMWGLQVDCGAAVRQTPVMVANLRLCLAGLHTAACSSSPPSSRLRPMGSRPARRAVSAAAAAQAAPPADVPPAGQPPKKRLAVFVSGGGSNFRAIHAAMLEGGVHGEVAVVVSNAPTCGGCQYAQAQGIPTLTFPAPKADPAAGLSPEQLVQQLTEVRGGGTLCRRRRCLVNGWRACVGWARLQYISAACVQLPLKHSLHGLPLPCRCITSTL